MSNTIYCLVCNKETSNHKFCSQSCSATYTNKHRPRRGKPKSLCLVCNNLCSSSRRKFCSSICCGSYYKIIDKKHHQSKNKERQAKYRAKELRKIHPTANRDKIKQIYKLCPEGYEVDHIIPLSLGGWHHEDNLQYLTKEENRRKSNHYIG